MCLLSRRVQNQGHPHAVGHCSTAQCTFVDSIVYCKVAVFITICIATWEGMSDVVFFTTGNRVAFTRANSGTGESMASRCSHEGHSSTHNNVRSRHCHAAT